MLCIEGSAFGKRTLGSISTPWIDASLDLSTCINKTCRKHSSSGKKPSTRSTWSDLLCSPRTSRMIIRTSPIPSRTREWDRRPWQSGQRTVSSRSFSESRTWSIGSCFANDSTSGWRAASTSSQSPTALLSVTNCSRDVVSATTSTSWNAKLKLCREWTTLTSEWLGSWGSEGHPPRTTASRAGGCGWKNLDLLKSLF